MIRTAPSDPRSALQGAPVSFDTSVEHFGPALSAAPRVAVAIPVKDEAERIIQCLGALAGQVDVALSDVVVLLLLNNCTDGTLEQVRSVSDQLPMAVRVHSVELPPGFANAGWARKLAMDAAADLARPEDGVILTTDADTLVNEDWVAQSVRELEGGLDAVAGFVMADPMELMELDAGILDRGRLEWEYQQMAAELQARADPEAHDPWPRHNQNCGASAAVWVQVYRRIGGLPPLPVGEDRALFEQVRRIDGKIRHSLEVQVVTSARTDGRAMGGVAEQLRLRGDPDHPCDDALEVAVSTLRRSLWRNQLRRAWEAGRLDGEVPQWADRLKLPVEAVRAAMRADHFGEFWAEMERSSRKLEWRLVTGAGLKREFRRMRRLVQSARRHGISGAA
jgi:glycosyltransferase involved in cell wall biosynthesis